MPLRSIAELFSIRADANTSKHANHAPRHNPAGTKLIKRFAKSKGGRAFEYQQDLDRHG